MKNITKYLLVLVLTFNSLVNAQNNTVDSQGDLFEGMTRKIMYDKMIPPYGLEVTFDKTVHIIFPSPVKYVDLGSSNIVAGKADGFENVIRVKAAIRNFEAETNFTVITQDGSFYTFNVKYANEPKQLNIEMKNVIYNNNPLVPDKEPEEKFIDAFKTDLNQESPQSINLIMRSIYNNNRRIIKHIGSKRFNVQYTLKSIYTNDNMLYLHTEIDNSSNVPFDIDFLLMKIVDRKVAKRTAIQETIITPVKIYNEILTVKGKRKERIIYAIEKITIPHDKQLIIELYEKSGGRNQSLIIENNDLIRARNIDDLRIR